MTGINRVLFSVALLVSVGSEGALRITMHADTHSKKKAERVHIRSVVTTDQGKCRVDMSFPKISTIALPSGDSYTLLHANKMLIKGKVDPKQAQKSAKHRSELQYRKIRSNVSIAGLTCDDYEVLNKGTKVMEMCLADLKANGLGQEIPKTANNTIMQTVFKDRVSEMPVGLPARLVSFAEGKAVFTNQIVKLERLSSVAPATFQVPASYKPLQLQLQAPKVKMPNLSGLFKF